MFDCYFQENPPITLYYSSQIFLIGRAQARSCYFLFHCLSKNQVKSTSFRQMNDNFQVLIRHCFVKLVQCALINNSACCRFIFLHQFVDNFFFLLLQMPQSIYLLQLKIVAHFFFKMGQGRVLNCLLGVQTVPSSTPVNPHTEAAFFITRFQKNLYFYQLPHNVNNTRILQFFLLPI